MVASRLDDHSNAFGKLRFQVRDTSGGMLVDFLKTLQPDYSVVYRDIAFGYAALIASVAAVVLAERAGAPFWLVTPLAALSIGYWIAYLMLFLHEGAHWNLAADPRVSDRICNGLISWWAGLEVSKYRPVHFQHHRALGTTEDSEFSYFFPLNLVFIAKGLLGIRAVEVLLVRERMTKSQDKKSEAGAGSVPPERKQALIGALFHLTCIGALALSGNWASAAAWAMGVGAVFPFFGALRQLLEHRAEDARADVDYHVTNHGAVSRMFGDGFVGRTFGGAGFNRHLLHHWEPALSYTRLADFERFLLDTELAGVVKARQTTYCETLLRLMHGSGAQ